MARCYKVLRADRAADKNLVRGSIVYDLAGHDYGVASDDSRMTGIEHKSVTLSSEGAYPFFTIPVDDLLAIKIQ